jgi:hypothetical protein
MQCAQLVLVSTCSHTKIYHGRYEPQSSVAFSPEIVTLVARSTDPASDWS